MKMGPLIVGVGVIAAGLFLTGNLPGFGSAEGANPAAAQQAASNAATQATDTASGGWTWLITQPWGWTAIVAAVGATLGVMTWRRIGGWGRGAVLISAAAAVAILVAH